LIAEDMEAVKNVGMEILSDEKLYDLVLVCHDVIK